MWPPPFQMLSTQNQQRWDIVPCCGARQQPSPELLIASLFLLCWLWVGTETTGLLGNHGENVEGEICACSIWTLEFCLHWDSEAGGRSWYPWRRQFFSGLFKSSCANVRCDRENMIQCIGLILENIDICVLSFTLRTFFETVAIFPSYSKLPSFLPSQQSIVFYNLLFW